MEGESTNNWFRLGWRGYAPSSACRLRIKSQLIPNRERYFRRRSASFECPDLADADHLAQRNILETCGERPFPGNRRIATASSADIENTEAFADSLAALTRHIGHLIDEPPQPPARLSSAIAVPRSIQAPDPAVVRYSLKVGVRVVAGFIVGITTNAAIYLR